jgi:hypothetical protein
LSIVVAEELLLEVGRGTLGHLPVLPVFAEVRGQCSVYVGMLGCLGGPRVAERFCRVSLCL